MKILIGRLIYTSFSLNPWIVLRNMPKAKEWLAILLASAISIVVVILGHPIIWQVFYVILLLLLSWYHTRNAILTFLVTTSILV